MDCIVHGVAVAHDWVTKHKLLSTSCYSIRRSTDRFSHLFYDRVIIFDTCVCVCVYLGICNNICGPRGHYAKWNKSDREKQITVWSHIWNLEYKTKKTVWERLIETERMGGCRKEGGLEGQTNEGDKRPVINKSQACNYSLRNMVSNIVINLCGNGWLTRLTVVIISEHMQM